MIAGGKFSPCCWNEDESDGGPVPDGRRDVIEASRLKLLRGSSGDGRDDGGTALSRDGAMLVTPAILPALWDAPPVTLLELSVEDDLFREV